MVIPKNLGFLRPRPSALRPSSKGVFRDAFIFFEHRQGLIFYFRLNGCPTRASFSRQGPTIVFFGKIDQGKQDEQTAGY